MSESTYRASDRVIFTPLVDGTGVLLHLDSKFYFTLNATGSAVWRHITGSDATIAELGDELAARFDVPPDAARDDVRDLLDELVSESLVEKSS